MTILLNKTFLTQSTHSVLTAIQSVGAGADEDRERLLCDSHFVGLLPLLPDLCQVPLKHEHTVDYSE